MLCKSPSFIKSMGGITGCGRCLPCRLLARKKRTFRILLETELYEKNSWYTLTYNEKFCPRETYHPKTGEVFSGDPSTFRTLSPKDIELFIKRVRKALPPRAFRYFLVGEYGEQHFRPHYHLVVFGYGPEIHQILRNAWTCPITKEPFGDLSCDAEHVNDWIAQYTAGYTVKKMRNKNDERLNGRYPEFPSSSQGIGRDAVPRLVDALGGPSAMAYIQTYEDIPRTVNYLGKSWPLDRYLREKILEALHLKTPLQEAGFSRYKKEMLRLQILGEPRTPNGSLASVLINQYNKENAQSVLNIETRANLYKKGDKL